MAGAPLLLLRLWRPQSVPPVAEAVCCAFGLQVVGRVGCREHVKATLRALGARRPEVREGSSTCLTYRAALTAMRTPAVSMNPTTMPRLCRRTESRLPEGVE